MVKDEELNQFLEAFNGYEEREFSRDCTTLQDIYEDNYEVGFMFTETDNEKEIQLTYDLKNQKWLIYVDDELITEVAQGIDEVTEELNNGVDFNDYYSWSCEKVDDLVNIRSYDDDEETLIVENECGLIYMLLTKENNAEIVEGFAAGVYSLRDWVNNYIDAGYNDFELYKSSCNAGLTGKFAEVKNGEIIALESVTI